MRSIWITAVAVLLVVAHAAAENTRFCTQDEKQLANKLHEQNIEPAKLCYRAANGDITTLAASRLCPLPECLTWLEYMAANFPNCYFDSKNYATIYAAKSTDCTDGARTSGSASSSANLRSSFSGSENSASFNNPSESNSNNSSSLSAMSEDRDLNTTNSLTSSINSFAAGEVPSVSGTGSAESASNDVEVDATTAPAPTPTEASTIEGASAPQATDSSNNTTPAPTTSASAPVQMVSSAIALIAIIASLGIELL